MKNLTHNIFKHDIEAAIFIIVGIALVASLTSYALESDRVGSVNNPTRNPVKVMLQDVDGDGLNDLMIEHADGHREVSYTRN